MMTKYYFLFLFFFISLITGYANSIYDENLIFRNGENGYAVYRTPGLVLSKQGTILAFSQGRVDGHWDEGDIDIVLKRSTDGGKTWGPLQVIENDGINPCKTGCPVVLDNGRILLMWLWNENIGHDEELRTDRKVYITYSDDDGLTWAQSREISDQTQRSNWGWYGLGPVHAIVKQRDPNKGRVIVPARHELIGSRTSSHLLYSDDNGETWNIGAISLRNRSTECTVVELSNGDLMLNSRNSKVSDGMRYVNISKDGGLTFSNSYLDPVLPFAGECQASLLNHSENKETGKSNILFSGPNHPVERVRGTFFLSNDDGYTWRKTYTYSRPLPAFSGYSDMIVLENGDVAVLFETGEKYTKPDRWYGKDCGVAFRAVESADIFREVPEIESQVITRWDFNPYNSTFPPSTGSGTLTVIGVGNNFEASTNLIASGSSDPVNPSTNNDALKISKFVAQGTASGTAGIEMQVSTVGFEDIKFSFDTKPTNASSKYLQVQYSVNGTDWVDSDTITLGAALWENNITTDFSLFTEINNNANFKIRLVTIFEPGTTAYAGVTKAYEANKLMHFDMVTISGSPKLVFSSIGSNGQGKTIDIYPNPFTELVSIRCNAGSTIAVYNQTGMLIEQFKMNTDTYSIDARNYPAGMYIISVQDGLNRLFSKLIKE
jgi:sialidase-1